MKKKLRNMENKLSQGFTKERINSKHQGREIFLKAQNLLDLESDVSLQIEKAPSSKKDNKEDKEKISTFTYSVMELQIKVTHPLSQLGIKADQLQKNGNQIINIFIRNCI